MRQPEPSAEERVARQRARYTKDIRIALACESGDFPFPCQQGQVSCCYETSKAIASTNYRLGNAFRRKAVARGGKSLSVEMRAKIASARALRLCIAQSERLSTRALKRQTLKASSTITYCTWTCTRTTLGIRASSMVSLLLSNCSQCEKSGDSCGNKRKKRSDGSCECDEAQEMHPLRVDDETAARLRELSVDDLRDLRDQNLNRKRFIGRNV